MPIALQRASSCSPMRRFSSLSLFTSWRASRRPRISPSSADHRCGYHAFCAPPTPYSTPTSAIRHTGQNYRDVAVRNGRNTRAQFSHLCDNIAMTRFCQNGHGQIAAGLPRRIRDVAQVISPAVLKIDALWRPDRQSVFPYTYRAHSGSSLYRRPPAPPARSPDPSPSCACPPIGSTAISTASPWPVPTFSPI